MPELPEVEVTRRSLAPALEGARVTAMRLGKPLRWPLGVAAEAALGRCIGALQRRGKYLWMPLAAPTPEPATPGLLWHLGMSGALRWWPAGAAMPASGSHDHAELETDRGLLRLTDPRRFGAVVWSAALDAAPAAALLARLGMEPFDPGLDAAGLQAALARHRAPIKQVLLAGNVVVGAGNIYACEALHRAGIHPARPAAGLGLRRCARLLQALRDTLAEAIAAGGSTLRDFHADGHAGAFQAQAQVYGREGQPCLRCGGAVLRRLQAQRSTFFCPRCQRR